MEKHGILKVKPELFHQLDTHLCVSYRKNMGHYEVLINDYQAFLKIMPDAIIDRASLDDMMLMYVKGEAL